MPYGFRPSSPILFGVGVDAFMLVDRQQRSLKAAHTRKFGKTTAEEWAATAHERPYSIADLGHAGPLSPVWNYFNGLTTHELRLECAMHGLPKPDKKYKVFEILVRHARSLVSDSASHGTNDTARSRALEAVDAPNARRALVTALRKGLIGGEKEIKKLKAQSRDDPWTPRSKFKKYKATHSPCTLELFATLFPHAAGKTKVAIEPSHLRVDRIGRGRLEYVPSSLSAQFDDAGIITVSGKYTMV